MFNLVDVHFRGCSWMRVQKGLPLPKICHTYHTMMKIGSYNLPKEDQKDIRFTHILSSADISIFSLEISCYMKKYRYRLHYDA